MGRIVVLDECGSTNAEAADRTAYGHGDAVIAVRQTAGRGQRGHKWDSVPGENLTFSVVLEPRFLPVARQFLLSEAVALALKDTLEEYGIEARIKWTNDIYVRGGKICGILLENDLYGTNLTRSVVGIGLNVNQTEFAEWVPNPASMSLETGRKYDVDEVFGRLYGRLMARYAQLENGDDGALQEEYNTSLFGLGVPRRFEIQGDGTVTGIIRGVRDDSTLLVEIDGRERGFLFGEIGFVI